MYHFWFPFIVAIFSYDSLISCPQVGEGGKRIMPWKLKPFFFYDRDWNCYKCKIKVINVNMFYVWLLEQRPKYGDSTLNKDFSCKLLESWWFNSFYPGTPWWARWTRRESTQFRHQWSKLESHYSYVIQKYVITCTACSIVPLWFHNMYLQQKLSAFMPELKLHN